MIRFLPSFVFVMCGFLTLEALTSDFFPTHFPTNLWDACVHSPGTGNVHLNTSIYCFYVKRCDESLILLDSLLLAFIRFEP